MSQKSSLPQVTQFVSGALMPDRLYRGHGLPVAIVGDWSEVTPARLAQWAEDLVPQLEPSRHRLSAGYWSGVIRSRAEEVARTA